MRGRRRTTSARIDATARREERKSTRARMRLAPRTVRRLLLVAIVYVGGFALLTIAVRGVPGGPRDVAEVLVPSVIVLAFLFETLDSAAGMGFGTALAPLLFVLGFGPLQVVPALLATEAASGLLAGLLHHEFRNVQFAWRPPNEATKGLLLIGGLGALGAVASAALAYFAVPLPETVIKAYVAIVVLLMGALILVRRWLVPSKIYRPRRLAFFAVLAGVNKGLGGGGYGPVITLGSIFSGIMEKTATAIATVAEGCVSTLAVLTFLAISTAGANVDLALLPSLWLGAVPAAAIAPYAVRVLPNQVWRYVVPIYAVGIAGVTLIKLSASP
jgi:uncharacterized membrane protein YfcA